MSSCSKPNHRKSVVSDNVFVEFKGANDALTFLIIILNEILLLNSFCNFAIERRNNYYGN